MSADGRTCPLHRAARRSESCVATWRSPPLAAAGPRSPSGARAGPNCSAASRALRRRSSGRAPPRVAAVPRLYAAAAGVAPPPWPSAAARLGSSSPRPSPSLAGSGQIRRGPVLPDLSCSSGRRLPPLRPFSSEDSDEVDFFPFPENAQVLNILHYVSMLIALYLCIHTSVSCV